MAETGNEENKRSQPETKRAGERKKEGKGRRQEGKCLGAEMRFVHFVCVGALEGRVECARQLQRRHTATGTAMATRSRRGALRETQSVEQRHGRRADTHHAVLLVVTVHEVLGQGHAAGCVIVHEIDDDLAQRDADGALLGRLFRGAVVRVTQRGDGTLACRDARLG